MKKIILSLGLIVLCAGVAMAQGKKSKKGDAGNDNKKTITNTPPASNIAVMPTGSLTADNMAFTDLSHEFGTVPEGPDATCEFTFKNTGKEPIIIEKAQPSCGCTVPSFSKEPVPPGATGTISVAYHTKGKPNPFTKTISVVSNAGTKVLTIKGNVEKAPSGSVPENTSMLKTN
jgi:Protein of unknown function (DUF1573)